MSLRRIGKYYYIDLRVRGAKKRIRRALHTSDKVDALDKYKEEKKRILAEYLRKDLKLEDFAKKYLDWAWSSKPASADREEQRIDKIKEFFKSLGIEYLSQITPYHIEQLKAKLGETGFSHDPKTPRLAAKATINRYLQLLRGMFYKAIDWEVYRGPNPVRKVKFFKEKTETKALSHAQVKKVLEAARDIAKNPGSQLQRIFPDVIDFAINTGLRKSEILNLEWKDLQGDEISIRGKGDRIRVVPLNVAARTIVGRQSKKDVFIFDIPNRGQPDLMRRTVSQIRKRTGIDFHLHLLRHYFATSLVEKGIDLITIAAILGHSKLTTSLIYSHTDKEKIRKAIDSLSN
jgi:integrase